MLSPIEKELIDYFHNHCELTIWFRKIVLQTDPKHYISIQDITADFITERNRILSHVPRERRRILRHKLNKVAIGYYSRVSHWSKKQKITIDMV